MARNKSTEKMHDRDAESPQAAPGGGTGPNGSEEQSPGAFAADTSARASIPEGGGDLQSALAECHERLMRLQAEMENVRRRTAREVMDERRYAPLPLVRDLLGVLDNVDRAIEAGEKNSDAASLLEGFRLVGRQLQSVLEKHEVQPILAEGEPFDPNFHEAILQQPSDQPSGTVVMVTQPGFRLHDRVVRPSQVIVSAGGQGN